MGKVHAKESGCPATLKIGTIIPRGASLIYAWINAPESTNRWLSALSPHLWSDVWVVLEATTTHFSKFPPLLSPLDWSMCKTAQWWCFDDPVKGLESSLVDRLSLLGPVVNVEMCPPMENLNVGTTGAPNPRHPAEAQELVQGFTGSLWCREPAVYLLTVFICLYCNIVAELNFNLCSDHDEGGSSPLPNDSLQ